VQALHQAHRLHRDIKPSNVLCTAAGRVVLCDFGLVRELSHEGKTQTADGLAGTVHYMSPEQAGRLALGEASDWYSVGVILYEALTGQLPYGGDKRAILVDKQVHAPAALRRLNPDAPRDLADLCEDLLCIRPDERPSGHQILARLGCATPPGGAVWSSLTSTHSLPFVGRADEVATLRAALADVQGGQSRLCLVAGESGMGKSALAARFLDEAHIEKGALVLAGRCYERESVPYKAFDAIVDALSSHLMQLSRASCDALLPPDLLALSRLFPILRRVDAIEEATVLGLEVPDPQELRRLAFAALRALLSRLARQRLLVLAIDDLQWGDLDSGRLLLEILRPPDAPALLVLASYRREASAESRLLASLLGHAAEGSLGVVRELAIGALPPAAARELAQLMLGPDHPRIDQVDAIARESDGNPFFLGELVRYVQIGPALRPSDADRGDGLGRVTLADVLDLRLAQLTDEARTLLTAIAVAGHPIELRCVRRAAAIADDGRKALATLRVDHLVRTMGVREEDRIEVYHDRIREWVVRGQDDAALRRWHERLARAYESFGGADAELLVAHWQGAGDPRKAAAYAATAAETAAASLAFDRAVGLYTLALDLGDPPADRRQALQIALGDALVNAGRGAEAAAVFLAAVPGASAALGLELRRRAAEQWLHTGHFDRGLDAIRAVLAAVGMKLAASPKRALLSLAVRRALIRLRGLGFVERDSSQVAAEVLSRIDIVRSVASGLSMIDTIRGADFQGKNLLLALRAGEPRRIALGLSLEAAFSATTGAPAWGRTGPLLAAALDLAQRIDDPHAFGFATSVSGIAHFLRGAWATARQRCSEAETILRERCTGVAWELASCQFFLFGAMFYLGELANLARLVPERLREAEDRGNLYAATGLRSWRTNVAWLARGDPDEARRQVEHAHQQWSHAGFHLQHYYELISHGQIDLYLGGGADSFARMSEKWRDLRRSMLLRVQNVRIEALHLRARSALAAWDTRADAALLDGAARDCRAIAQENVPWAQGLAILGRAGIAAARADRDAAQRLLDEAEARFTSADMRLYAAACRVRRSQLRSDGHDEAALAEIGAMGAKEPARIVAMLAPGFTA
jgi:hypothetical protein